MEQRLTTKPIPAALRGIAPIRPVANLTTGLVASLAAQIESGAMAPGQRLPTEQAIVAATGVSRTVVREALASLRARGLITTRQGLGAFVADAAATRSFTLASEQSRDAVLQILELRLAIESDAAALAAARRTEAELDGLRAALDRVLDAVQAGQSGAEEDHVFHRLLVGAAHNPYYARVLDVIGSALIPRQRVRLDELTSAARARYVRHMHEEHEAIVAAVAKGDGEAARRAMVRHLSRARARFAKTASVFGDGGAGDDGR